MIGEYTPLQKNRLKKSRKAAHCSVRLAVAEPAPEEDDILESSFKVIKDLGLLIFNPYGLETYEEIPRDLPLGMSSEPGNLHPSLPCWVFPRTLTHASIATPADTPMLSPRRDAKPGKTSAATKRRATLTSGSMVTPPPQRQTVDLGLIFFPTCSARDVE